MLRVILVGGLLALSGVISLVVPAVDNRADTCLSEENLWGAEDPTKFYFCYEGTPIEADCPTGTLFINNGTLNGCYAYNELSDACSYHGPVYSCTGVYVTQPQPSENPAQFYFCPAENADIVLLSCKTNHAFVKTAEGYMGCFPWPEWRRLTGCTM